MEKKLFHKPKLKRGDLVSHYLYPREWWALVLADQKELTLEEDKDIRVLVNIVPGTEHINYFRNLSGRGWIYRKWLWVPGVNDGRLDEYETLCLGAKPYT